MHQFNDQFVKYIKSGSQTPPEGIVYAQACVNIDKFLLNEITNWGFSKVDFVMLIKNVA